MATRVLVNINKIALDVLKESSYLQIKGVSLLACRIIANKITECIEGARNRVLSNVTITKDED